MSQKFHQMISRTLIDLMIIICIPMSSADETGIRPSKMSEFVTVDIPQGRLRGKSVTSSSNGVTYYSFQGIPYAKPPVGPLRFKPPEEPEPWTGTRDATVEGAVAPFIYAPLGITAGSEDCLFLNVYTPQWPMTSRKTVMVWIHGGAFIIGSGNTDMYGPDFLIAEDVVLVTLNYRLGALGFLYLDGADVTGNNGLRDQVSALKWVKKNIAHFGGDASNVTIFGESAGGVSVHYLILSPLAQGLFHRAIAQSGTALIGFCNAPRDVSTQRAILLAKLLGCTSEQPQEVADFLRTVPAEKLVAQQSKALLEEERHRVLAIPFCPTEEVGSESFLPALPRDLLREGRFSKVPFITGVTSAEGKVVLLDMFASQKLSELNQRFENVLPSDLVPKIGTTKSKELADSIKKFYFGESHFGDDKAAQFVDMMSDLAFLYPMRETVLSNIRCSRHPTYVYLFDHMNESRISFLTDKVDDLPGAPHGADLSYLFESTAKPRPFPPGSSDAQVRAALVKLWTQFAKTGNPSSDEVNVTWTPVENETIQYLKINGDFSMDSDMYKHRLDFIEEVFNKFEVL